MIALVLTALIAFAIFKMTAWGWRFWSWEGAPVTQPEQLMANRMRATVEQLSIGIGNRSYASPESLEKARRFITAQLKGIGYPVEFFSYKAGQQEFHNIIAKKAAAGGKSSGVLIVGAHYDTCFNPGADDNASGIAGLIEVARALKDARLDFDIHFIAFVNEEPPFFTSENMGSRRYARWLKEQRVTVKGAVILEMIGFYSSKPFSQQYFPLIGAFYPNRGDFIAIISNFPSRNFLKQIKKGFAGAKRLPVESLIAPEFVPGIYFSDHWSFWQEGWPALMITDTAFKRSPHYHKPSDLPDTLNYEKMAQVVTALKEAILGLSK